MYICVLVLYSTKLSGDIVESVTDAGGLFSPSDLSLYIPRIDDCTTADFQGYRLHTNTYSRLLMVLGLIEGQSFADNAATLHNIVESNKISLQYFESLGTISTEFYSRTELEHPF